MSVNIRVLKNEEDFRKWEWEWGDETATAAFIAATSREAVRVLLQEMAESGFACLAWDDAKRLIVELWCLTDGAIGLSIPFGPLVDELINETDPEEDKAQLQALLTELEAAAAKLRELL